MQYAASHSTVATDFDSLFNNWATEGLNYYVVAKLNWNPNRKIDDIINDYCNRGFGPAGPSIRAYFKRVDDIGAKMYPEVNKLYTDDPKKVVVSARADLIPKYWTPAVFKDMHALLQQADTQVAGDSPENKGIRDRIAFLRVGLDWTEIQSKAYQVLMDYNQKKPVDLVAASKLLAQRKAMMHDIFEQNTLAVNVANINFGDRGYWSGLQKACDAATHVAPTKDGATTIDADENGVPIVVPQH